VRLLSGHAGWVRSVAYTPDGRGLATGSNDQTVRLWDTRTGELRHALQGAMRWVDLTQFSPDGRTLISTSLDGAIHLWDAENHALQMALQEQQAATRALAFSHDGARVLCGSDDHTARLWDTRTGALVEVLQGHQGPVRSVAISPDGRYLVTGSHDDTLRVWDGAAKRLHLVLRDVHARIQFAMAFHPGGDLLACCRLDHTITLLHHASGKVLASVPMADKSPSVVAFDAQGRRLACGSRDGAVWLWDLDVTGSGEARVAGQAWQVQLSGEAIWRVLFSPDARLLACVGAGQDIHVLDAVTGQVRYSVANPYGAYCLAFSRDSSRLVTAGADHTVLLRDASTGDVLQALRGHTSGLTSLSVSPDGTRLASSSADGTVRLWRMDTGEHLATLEPDGPYHGMNISGATGITAAQRVTLLSLGAVESSRILQE
jgi:WD40 repeat protein